MKLSALEYHQGTVHPGGHLFEPAHNWNPSLRPTRRKRYLRGDRLQLPMPRRESGSSIWEALDPPPTSSLGRGIASLGELSTLLHYSNGVTKYLRGSSGQVPFRAAACTGALYHIEVYVVTAGYDELSPGVYYYEPEDHELVPLRAGDPRVDLANATGNLDSIRRSSTSLVFTDVYWRNAVKYQAREYRHAWWDLGTVLANELAVQGAAGGPREIVLGFLESPVERLLGIDGQPEFPLAVVPVGDFLEPTSASVGAKSARAVDDSAGFQTSYPALEAIHESVRLQQNPDLKGWRRSLMELGAVLTQHDPSGVRPSPGARRDLLQVIRQRGSTRRFSQRSIRREDLETLLEVATHPAAVIETGARVGAQFTSPYLIVNSVDDLPAGNYRWESGLIELERGTPSEMRLKAASLALGQSLGGDAALNVYFLADLASMVDEAGDRVYRLAQLDASLAAGRIYLAAYALGLGATGLTFFDQAVIDHFSPPAGVEQVMFLIAVGQPDY